MIELENYIDRGSKKSAFPSESLESLNELIDKYDKSDAYKSMNSLKEYINPGEKEQFFIALAAPSMAGKTQIAFSIRSKRPLYFALDDSQYINKNFTKLTQDLVKAVKTRS